METSKRIQERGDGGLHQSGGCEDRKKEIELRHILETLRRTGVADGWNVAPGKGISILKG